MTYEEADTIVRSRLREFDIYEYVELPFTKMVYHVPIDSGDPLTRLIGRAVACMACLERNKKRTKKPEVFVEAAMSWLQDACALGGKT